MNTVFSEGEKEIAKAELTKNTVFFWRKSKFVLTNKRLVSQVPQGKYEIFHPVKSISSVGCCTKAHPMRLIFGIFLLLCAVTIHSFGSLIIYGIPALMVLLSSYTTKFEVFTNSARPQEFEVSILERGKTKDFVTHITTLITGL
jgi:hypothetical protein